MISRRGASLNERQSPAWSPSGSRDDDKKHKAARRPWIPFLMCAVCIGAAIIGIKWVLRVNQSERISVPPISKAAISPRVVDPDVAARLTALDTLGALDTYHKQGRPTEPAIPPNTIINARRDIPPIVVPSHPPSPPRGGATKKLAAERLIKKHAGQAERRQKRSMPTPKTESPTPHPSPAPTAAPTAAKLLVGLIDRTALAPDRAWFEAHHEESWRRNTGEEAR